MKLSDCKPGVRVRVYDGNLGSYIGEIVSIDDKNMVVIMRTASFGYHYPQQLRKIVPKKDKPTVGFAFNQDGSWNMPVELTYTNTIDLLKRQGCDVWVMRGTRKL